MLGELRGNGTVGCQSRTVLLHTCHACVSAATCQHAVAPPYWPRRHVASILRDPKAYEDAEREKRRHIYTVREGLVYGPLGVPDVDAHIKGGAAVHPA